jgi:uncharacterized protein involved in exopolysaccharide biosynthesis
MDQQQRQFFVRDVLTVVFKHLSMIIFLPLVIAAVVVVLSYMWPPSYESLAKVQIIRGREVSQPDTSVTKTGNDISMLQLSVEDINSEIEQIRSENVLRATVTEPIVDPENKLPALVLKDDPDFPYGAGLLQVPVAMFRATVTGVMYLIGLKSRPDPVRRAMDALDDRLEVEPVRDSYVIEVRLRLGDREKARRVLGALIEQYQKHHIGVFSNEKSEPFFQKQLDRVSKDLDAAQAALKKFKDDHQISLLDVEEGILLGQYTEAKKILTQLQQTEEAVSTDNIDASVISSISSQTESTTVREMQLRLLELLLEHSRVVQSLGPKHPTVVSLTQQITNAQTSLIEAIANTKQITQKKLDTAQARLQQLNDTKAEHEKLFKNVALLSANYDYYASKVEEARVADKLAEENVSNVRVASAPSLPVDPVTPNKVMNLVLALVGGLIFALGLAFFRDYLDHGLKTPEDVEAYLRITTLGSFFNKPGQVLDSREAERMASLLDTVGPGDSGKVFEVTSSVPGEGASQLSDALAQAFSNDPDAATLLIDLTGDIARVRSAQGLSDVLTGAAQLDSVFTRDGALTIVGKGTQGSIPAQAWGSEKMRQILGDLRKRYRYIIFNAGPALQSQDAIRVARIADGIVIAIKADATRREVVQRVLSLLGEARNKVVGAALTQRTQAIPQAVYRRI